MTLYGIQLPVIIIALITAFVGYQFNFRAKKREVFLKELSNSYNEVYFPMNELLKEILKTADGEQKKEQLIEFFKQYNGSQSKVKFIGTSSVLECFYELNHLYNLYNSETSRTNDHEFWKKFKSFQEMIEAEFWEAHDIIYEDHLKFKSFHNKNPFLIGGIELINLIYYFSFITFGVSSLNLFLWIYCYILNIDIYPEWWHLEHSIWFFVLSLGAYGTMLMYSTLTIKKNKRSSVILKGLKKKIFRNIRA